MFTRSALLKWSIRIALVLLALVAVLLASLVLLEKKWGELIVRQSIATINRELKVPISTSTADFTFFDNFPHASLHLRNVIIPSSHQEVFGKHDTLLIAKSLFIVLNPFDLVKGKYEIASVKITQGYLNIKHAPSGEKNYDLFKNQSTPQRHETPQLRFNRILLEQIYIDFKSPAEQLDANMLVSSLRARGAIAPGAVRLSITTEGLINRLRQAEFIFALKQNFALKSDLTIRDSIVSTKATTLNIDRNRLAVKGTYCTTTKRTELAVQGSHLDLKTLIAFASQYQLALPTAMDIKGLLSADLNISGGLRQEDKLQIVLGIAGENLQLAYKGQSYNLATFQGRFSNGAMASKATSAFEITKCALRKGASRLDLLCRIANLNEPTIYSKFDFLCQNNDIFIEELKPYLPNYQSIRGNGECLGSFAQSDSLTFASIKNPKIRLEADFDNITITPNPHQTFDSLHGSITLLDYDLIKGAVRGRWNGAPFSVGIHTKNILSVLSKKGRADWTINTHLSDWHIPDNFVPAWNPTADQSDTATSSTRSIWDEVSSIQGNLSLANCTYRGEPIDSLAARFSATPSALRVDIQQATLLSGSLRGKVNWDTPDANQQLLTAEVYPLQIDLATLFRAFQDFGQQSITHENISGRLSGAISLYAPLEAWRINPKLLQLRANITVLQGALVNVKGLERLARFISLEELRNIRFSTLSNEISIYNQCVVIPRMNIRSSAIDLSLSGEQYFNSQYKYHVGLRLSDLLFSKVRSRQRTIDENALAEHDEQSGASLFLIIEGDSINSNVRYDHMALSNRIRDAVQTEKNILKDLVNQEFAKDVADTVTLKRRATTRPSFSIEWVDDSTKKQMPPTTPKPLPKNKQKTTKPPPTIVWDDD